MTSAEGTAAMSCVLRIMRWWLASAPPIHLFKAGTFASILFYAGATSFRDKKNARYVWFNCLYDSNGKVIIWMYGWYFLWRHLIVQNISSDALDRLLAKSRILKWNVETIGFSPNGFTGYFIFKILLVAFAGMIFIHAVAFFMRSFQELREGQSSENKYKDLDELRI